MVAGEDDHVLGLLAADGVDVLVDGIGGAHVPVGAGALHGRHQLKELAQLLGHNARPAFADVPVERERLVLGEDEDLAQAGVDAVGEGDVDDAVVPAKGHGRLGAIAGKGKEPFSGPARKQYSKCVSHVRCTLPSLTFLARNPPSPGSIAAIRHGMFSGDTSSVASPNGGEYHTQMNLAAVSASEYSIQVMLAK